VRVLTLNPKDGKMILQTTKKSDSNYKEETFLEYLSLNPALTIKRLLDQADKIILASGTLEPTEEYDVLNRYLQGQDLIYKF
jgi:Rad3-related DNA helicase